LQPTDRPKGFASARLGGGLGAVYKAIYVFSYWLTDQEGTVNRERALKILLLVVGLLFTALVYPLMMFVRQEPALAMMFSVDVTLGIFLLLATRNPSANRSLIAFTAWSSFAHAALMAMQVFLNMIQRSELVGVAVLCVIGVAFLVLAPAKQAEEQAVGV
jgi:drug/metabolite transporter superfamily protein YnfA